MPVAKLGPVHTPDPALAKVNVARIFPFGRRFLELLKKPQMVRLAEKLGYIRGVRNFSSLQRTS
jgi:hypothetical protein